MVRTPPPTNKGKTFPPEPLSPAEVKRMLDAADTETVSGIRLRAIIGVLFGSGLRINEALSLMPKDIDFEEGTVKVMRGKGKKHRLVGIDPYSKALVKVWMDKRVELGLTRQHYIFTAYRGKAFGNRMTRRHVSNELKRLAAEVGIEKRVHPHGMRHSMAGDLAKRNVPVHQIQRQLGHSSLVMTERYLRGLSPQDVIDMMQDRDWAD